MTPKYTRNAKINEEQLQCLPGSLQIYKSVETIADPQELVYYPLDAFSPSRLPLHVLRLNIGSPVMWLINLELPKLLHWNPPHG